MGFLSASSSFTRYQVIGQVDDIVLKDAVTFLKRNGFNEIENSAEERSFGWVCFDDMLDSSWDAAPPEKAEFLAFSLRLDTRRIPPAVMKKHMTLALREYRETIKQQGRKHISKDEKQEVQERVRLKLLSKTFPIPAVFEVIWNTSTGRMYLGSVNTKIQELFEELFYQTFQARVKILDPFEAALQESGEKNKERLLTLESAIFV